MNDIYRHTYLLQCANETIIPIHRKFDIIIFEWIEYCWLMQIFK